MLTSYTYDAGNRLTQIVYSKTGLSTQTINLNYDQTGPNYAYGPGRLTSTAYPAGTSQYQYDAQGRITQHTQYTSAATGANASALTHRVSYGYGSTGLTQITYPSGRVLSVNYNVAGQLSSMSLSASNSTSPRPLIQEITHEPFGPANQWQFVLNNGYLDNRRTFDSSGRLVRYRLGSAIRDLTYDAAGRITNYTHYSATDGSAQTGLNQTFGYDANSRLTSINTAGSTWGITYDANGNRTGLTLNGSPRTYTTPSTSNKLQSISNPARSLLYDDAGNITSDSAGYTATIDAAGRLSTLTKAGVTTTYDHNALGQRVRKFGSNGGSSTLIFVHDLQGHVLGEYDQTGAPIREYVWLGDTPLAVFTPDPANSNNPPVVYFIQADHLDTPRVVVDKNNQLRWRWMAEPFGTTAPETDPAGLGTFNLPLRFPGQYADQESGLNYNYFRNYDSSTGRYTQSDPIGLAGGINTYSYVAGNPPSHIDPTGQIVIADDIVIGGGVLVTGCLLSSGCRDAVGGAISSAANAAAEVASSAVDAIKEFCLPDNRPCPACKTVSGRIVPVGTIGYRPLDIIPDDQIQHGVAGSHHNIFIAKQNPNNCQCFWAKQKYVLKPGQLPPGAVPVEPFVN